MAVSEEVVSVNTRDLDTGVLFFFLSYLIMQALTQCLTVICDTYTHLSESGSTDPNCILLLATSRGYLSKEDRSDVM